MPGTPPPIPARNKLDPRKQALREEVDERNKILQERGVPAPASGTFGKPPSKGSAKIEG